MAAPRCRNRCGFSKLIKLSALPNVGGPRRGAAPFVGALQLSARHSAYPSITAGVGRDECHAGTVEP